MNLQAFINALQHENSIFRLNAAHSLGMVAEVDAFEPMGVVFQQETDPEVKEAMHWAGKQILQAKQQGMTTLDRVFEVFNINAEILNMPDPKEAKLMQAMQDNLDRDLLSMKKQGLKGKAGLTIAAGLAGAAMGGMVGAAGAAMTAGTVLSGSTTNHDRSVYGTKRIPATASTGDSIKIWSQRLLSDANSNTRLNAARELLMINNPAAVPNLATAYLNDPETDVRDEAYRCGVELYLRMRYWTWTQDGTIEAEFERRAVAAGKILKDTVPPFITTEEMQLDTDPVSPRGTNTLAIKPTEPEDTGLEKSAPEDIAEILRKAEESRAKRKRR